jgi:hypothetical protein
MPWFGGDAIYGALTALKAVIFLHRYGLQKISLEQF